MKTRLLPLAFLLAVLAQFAASGAEPPKSPPTTNEMVILADDGFEYAAPQAVYKGNVRVFDPQMDLMCELLTVYFQTNQTNSGKIETIVAETNVVIAQKDSWATGDRAIYTATNDVVDLLGNVVLDTPQGYLMGARVIFDRKNNKLYAPGKVIMGSHPGANLFGTNSLGLALPGGGPPPARPSAAKPSTHK